MINSRPKIRLLATLVLGSILLWVILSKTASNLYDSRQPAVALGFDGGNHRALSNLAVRSLTADGTRIDATEATALARKAVRISPRDSDALAILGYSMMEASDGDREAGLELIERAYGYSVRAPVPQMLLIQEAARAGDIEGVLRYYDLALTTHPDSQVRLMPQLFLLLGDPTLRAGLVQLLVTNPTWKKDFWLGVTNQRPIPPDTISLLAEIGERGAGLIPGIDQRLVRALVSEGRFDEARRVAMIEDKTDRVVAGAGDLDDFTREDPLPGIDWRYYGSGTHAAIPAGESLTVSVRGKRSEKVADRLMRLQPNTTYSLNAVAHSEYGAGAITVGIRCARARRPIAAAQVELRDRETARLITGPFRVPDNGCEWSWLEILGSSENSRASDFVLSQIELEAA